MSDNQETTLKDNSSKNSRNDKLFKNVQLPVRGTEKASARGVGIDAIHINAAREMVQLHTRGRNPPVDLNNRVSNAEQTTSQHNLIGDLNGLRNSLPRGAPAAPSMVKPKSQLKSKSPLISQTKSQSPVSSHSYSSSFPKQRISIPKSHPHQKECRNPQFDQPKLDYLGDNVFEFPLPEMIFGNNYVRIKYVPHDKAEDGAGDKDDDKDIDKDLDKDKSGEIWFNSIDALKTLDDDCKLKVSYHEEWLESRQKNSKKQQLEKRGGDAMPSNIDAGVVPIPAEDLISSEGLKPYDWTYSTNYKGLTRNLKFVGGDELDQKWEKDKGKNNGEGLQIPIARLMQPDPILFFDEMILFEDELADNGISMLSTKIRVMPTCLLILCRFFLRLDNVIFRVRDCRVFIDLDKDEVIREYKVQEDTYDNVLKKSIRGGGSGGAAAAAANDPKRLLRDQNWVSSNLPVISRTIEKCDIHK
ncbi:Tap42 interacting protein [Lodderomyces elongisporus]|uniref:Tap42 interacting protein n=1 Tax=Lodderomyces elongisporus TaxID=36914 RepID=UPI002922E52C|nr:Tap42 interacting protein [Lodderomyces elongisporus]WLF81090.1 Tap42 interacting protein [Lodderomyces elongisporus]